MNSKGILKSLSLVGASTFLTASAMAALAPHVPGELIVKFKQGHQKSMGVLGQVGAQVDRTIDLSSDQLHVIKTTNKSLESVISQLESDPNIEFAEPNFIYNLVKPVQEVSLDDMLRPIREIQAPYSTPNDPQFEQLWGLQNTGDNEPRSSQPGLAGADIDAMKAWGITKGSSDVTIAVIDTGIDYNHPDLAENMWANPNEIAGNGIDDDNNGYIDDVYGYNFAVDSGDPIDGHSHGTHCAGTIGAVHDNAEGVAGVMSNVNFVAVKFLSDSGSGTSENAIKSVDYATQLDVDIMSNSWGGGGRSQALEDAIQRANDKGILFVVAAGNSSSNNDSRPQYPANYEVDNVISVAASTAQDDLASFSCYGRNTVHIAAPGHRILSTTKNGGYSVYSGTSMAAPHVSGALGLLLAQEGRLPVKQVRDRLMATSEPVPALRGKTINGGRLNAYNLLTDTRPDRNAPKPGEWVSVDLDEVFESSHPYEDNTSVTREYSVEGAKYMRLKVREYDLESGYDFLEVANANGLVIEKISGKGSDYASDYIEGDSMSVTFSSDSSINAWGFLIDQIEVQYE